MGQTWDDLLFSHYRVKAADLRGLVSDQVEVEEHSGSAWLGVTPFAVVGLRPRGLPAFPFVSSFLELNVRTYVSREGKPGIWFFSLDASSRLAVEAARRFYRLPYFQASISLTRQGETCSYECSRHSGKVFSGSYRPAGDAFEAENGTLEHFLTERYCLYTEDRGSLYRAEIHHRPWQLQPAEAQIDLNTMPPSALQLDDEPLLHYSARQDVVIWPLARA
jgi:uncharacterized protein